MAMSYAQRPQDAVHCMHAHFVLQVTELAILVTLPNWVLQWRVVKPMRYMVAGTMLVSHMLGAKTLSLATGLVADIKGIHAANVLCACPLCLLVALVAKSHLPWVTSSQYNGLSCFCVIFLDFI